MRRFLWVVLGGGLFTPITWAQAPYPPTNSQAIDIQRYKAGPGAADFLGVHGAAVGSGWHLGTQLNYADRPLVLNHLGLRYPVVDTQVTMDLLASFACQGFELGVALPLTYQASERGTGSTPLIAEGVTGSGVGDFRMVPKAHLLSVGALDLSLAVPLHFPTAGGRSFRGGAGVAVRPQLVGEWAFSTGLRIVTNLGGHLRSEEQAYNLRAGNEFLYALGAQLPFGQHLSFQTQFSGAVGRTWADRSMELLAGARYQWSSGFAAFVGGGPGLTRGFGTPRFRTSAGLTWTRPSTSQAAVAPIP